jgi:hypothetical protein
MSIAELRAKLGSAGVEPTMKREPKEAGPQRPRVIWPKRWSLVGAGTLCGAPA